jgi:hypothetical protein
VFSFAKWVLFFLNVIIHKLFPSRKRKSRKIVVGFREDLWVGILPRFLCVIKISNRTLTI